MEKVSRTANISNLSLRYSLTHRSFENKASSSATEQKTTSVRNSDDDVDFDDVFGGPPTRTRYSFGNGRIKSSEESSSGIGERPVFGESYSSPRRRASDDDDFYGDIFRSSSESARSPRCSRTLSPKNIEAFSTSVPSDFRF